LNSLRELFEEFAFRRREKIPTLELLLATYAVAFNKVGSRSINHFDWTGQVKEALRFLWQNERMPQRYALINM
jgi:hypothetical protein